ncbi:hypothetical protein EJB05_41477, partial [Eragrostis curvula]
MEIIPDCASCQPKFQADGSCIVEYKVRLELWHHTFGYIKSMALKSALDLRIADAIHVFTTTVAAPPSPRYVFVSPFLGLGEWFQHELPEDPALFEAAHGQSLWDFTGRDTKFSKLFDNGMVADCGFAMDITKIDLYETCN